MEVENRMRFLWRENGVIDPMAYDGRKDFYGKFLIVGEDRPKFFIAVGGKKGEVPSHLSVRDEMRQGSLRSGGFIDIFPNYGVAVFYGKVENMNLSFTRKDVIWVAKSMAHDWSLRIRQAIIFGTDMPRWGDKKSMRPLSKCMVEKYEKNVFYPGKKEPFLHDDMFFYLPLLEYAVVDLLKA